MNLHCTSKSRMNCGKLIIHNCTQVLNFMTVYIYNLFDIFFVLREKIFVVHVFETLHFALQQNTWFYTYTMMMTVTMGRNSIKVRGIHLCMLFLGCFHSTVTDVISTSICVDMLLKCMCACLML